MTTTTDITPNVSGDVSAVFVSEKEEEYLRILQKRIQGNKELGHFKEFITDRFLLHFIRGRKYNVNIAYDTVVKYFHVRRKKYPELFSKVIPSQVNIQMFCIRPLRKLSPNGSIVLISRPTWWPTVEEFESSKLTLDDVIHRLILVFEEIWKNPSVEVNGIEVILEFEGFLLGHAKHLLSVPHVLKGVSIFFKAFPLKYKKMHYVSAPGYFKKVHCILSKFVPSKLAKRVHVHDDETLDSLHSHLPKDMLPTWLGGDLTDDEAFDQEFHQALFKNEEYYLKLKEKLK